MHHLEAPPPIRIRPESELLPVGEGVIRRCVEAGAVAPVERQHLHGQRAGVRPLQPLPPAVLAREQRCGVARERAHPTRHRQLLAGPQRCHARNPWEADLLDGDAARRAHLDPPLAHRRVLLQPPQCGDPEARRGLQAEARPHQRESRLRDVAPPPREPARHGRHARARRPPAPAPSPSRSGCQSPPAAAPRPTNETSVPRSVRSKSPPSPAEKPRRIAELASQTVSADCGAAGRGAASRTPPRTRRPMRPPLPGVSRGDPIAAFVVTGRGRRRVGRAIPGRAVVPVCESRLPRVGPNVGAPTAACKAGGGKPYRRPHPEPPVRDAVSGLPARLTTAPRTADTVPASPGTRPDPAPTRAGARAPYRPRWPAGAAPCRRAARW